MSDRPNTHSRTGAIQWIITVFVAAAMMAGGCTRDGFECSSNSDCFGDESCQSGTCISADEPNNTCRASSDDDLCAAAQPCQTSLEVTDSCGTVREIDCECADACVPETTDTICQRADATCGSVTTVDTCGDTRTVMCGMCTPPDSCIENNCAPRAPPSCPTEAQCGIATNRCGDTIECGTCQGSQLCIDYSCGEPSIQPDDVEAGDRFGEEIEIDGDYLLIGAPHTDSDELDNVGAIYVYRRLGSSFALTQVLYDSEPESDARFGQIFDARDGRLLASTDQHIVNFRRDENGQYQSNGGVPVRSRVAALGLLNDGEFLVGFEDLGNHETLVTGRCTNAECSLDIGAWEAPNNASDAGALGLGMTIATAGDTAIVGAPFDNIVANDEADAEGSVYLLTKSSTNGPWVPFDWRGFVNYQNINFTQFFMDDEPSTRAGSSVAVTSDGFAGFGAPDSNAADLTTGVGEVFLMSPRDTTPFDRKNRYRGVSNSVYESCGFDLGFMGPTDSKLALVSCLYARERGESPTLSSTQRQQTVGAIRRYSLQPIGDWRLVSPELKPPAPEAFDHFGWSIATDETIALVGAPGRDNDRGTVYIYQFDDINQ